MTKSILKEIIIVLLLCLAIILVLGIILYEYVPVSKTVPSPVAYTTPEEVQQELIAASGVDESQIMMTYEVNGDDLNNYKRVQNYKPGKANPFSSYEQEEQINAQNTANASSSGTGSASQNNNAGSTNGQTNENNSNGSTQNGNNGNSGTQSSGGQFFQDKGTK